MVKGMVGVSFLAVAGIVSCGAGYQHLTDEDVIFTVTDKERIVESDGESTSSKYLVSTVLEDGSVEVFENTDAWLSGKFASSDVQAKLQEGKTYEATVYGWRIPLVSTYRNIVDVQEVPPKTFTPVVK